MKLSLTAGGIAVAVAGTLLMDWGFSETCSNEIVTKLPLLIGSAIAWYGRFRQGDVNVFGFKK